ncbi:MAG: hypothetical protein OSA51_06055 [Octadecabacter sp.]|nr:hypothetical protein [Octadecabacter sp.]
MAGMMLHRLRLMPIKFHQIDYLTNTLYSRFNDFVFKQLSFTRAVIYITPIFRLITVKLYHQILKIYVQVPFECVKHPKLLSHRPFTLSLNSRRELAHSICSTFATHPSPCKASFQQKKAKCIARTVKAAA